MRHGTCFRRRLSAHHAGAAPHSAVAELGVVSRRYAHPVIRCPKCSKLAVRDVQRCDCGHSFSGNEPDAAPTPKDVAEWQRTHSESAPQAQQPLSSTGIRVAVVAAIFIAVQFIAPAFVRPDDLRGGLLAYIVVPGLFIATWVVFSVALVAAFVTRDGSTVSAFACIGYAFIFALVSTLVLLPRILPSGSYGPGP